MFMILPLFTPNWMSCDTIPDIPYFHKPFIFIHIPVQFN